MIGDPFPEVALPPVGTSSAHFREASLSRGRWRARCVISNSFPDASVFDNPVDTSGMFVLWRVDVDSEGRGVIELNPAALGDAPPIWFVMIPEENAERPAMSMAGFPTDHIPVGTVLTDPMFFSLPVKTTEQVGAVRWWHHECVVDQVFVDPKWRRRGVATQLLYAIDAWQVLHGFPGHPRSDHRRTEMGQHLDAAARFPERFKTITQVSPPMDPTAKS